MNNNNYQNQKIRGLKRKYEYILNHGGKCEICGYNKNIAALEFHHKNPEEKEFQIDLRKFANCDIDKLNNELNKCIILCANCHREIHNPELSIINTLDLIKDVNKKSFNSKKSGRICPVCGNRFPISTGKIYCSDKCRESVKFKNYPTLEEIEERYKELKN